MNVAGNFWRHTFLIQFVRTPDLDLYFRDECNSTGSELPEIVDWCQHFSTSIQNHQAQVSSELLFFGGDAHNFPTCAIKGFVFTSVKL